ncbi:MAG: PQQ-binding-like beta-propeller repeat protein [Thermoplasmata archaeon]
MSDGSGSCPAGSAGPAPSAGGEGRRAALVVAAAALTVLLLLLPSLALASPVLPRGHVGAPGSAGPLGASALLDASGAWTTFHGSENRTGYFPGPGPTSSLTTWVVCPSTLPLRVGPVLNATLLFVIDDFGTAYALNRDHNGSVVWKQSIGGTPTTADLAGATLVVGGSNGYVTGLLASTGGVLWRTALGAPIVQGAAVDNGTVFVGTSAGNLTALGLFDGTRRWTVALDLPIAGAPTIADGTIYVVASNGSAGELSAIGEDGTIDWTRALPAPVASAAAVGAGEVVLADLSGNVSAYASASGALTWRTSDGVEGDRFESTPSVTPTSVYASSDLGVVLALDRTNGSVRWSHVVVYSGYRVLASPVATSTGIYLVDASEMLEDLTLDGRVVWATSLGETVAYATPAADVNTIYATNDIGCVYDFGSTASATLWPVTGLVEDPHGRAIPATVLVASLVVSSASDGTFTVDLPNGTFLFTVYASGYFPLARTYAIAGPPPLLVFVLTPLPRFPVVGVVEDGFSGHGVPNASLTFRGPYGFLERSVTGPTGGFEVALPNGTIDLRVAELRGYAPLEVGVTVDGGVPGPVVVHVAPTGASVTALNPGRLDVVLPLVAVALAALAVGLFLALSRDEARRVRATLVAPTTQFVAMRALLIVPQALFILTVLYLFGTYLPEAIHGVDFCVPLGTLCQRLPWARPLADLSAFGNGWWTFVANLFTGNWGYARYNHLDLPATQYLAWWLPNSLQIAVVALPLSALIAYPLGLVAGWRRDSAVDWGVRMGSLVGLLLPSFLVVLLLLGPIYAPFTQAFGDAPYGVLPTTAWFATHGGEPAWIGIGSNTSPTGFPLVDGALHGAWSFEAIVLGKVALQSFAIAILYAAIYLRFARNAVAAAASASYLTAARARGVPDHDLLWRHTSRRALPVFVLIFGLTLPVYIGTQAVVEAMFSDQGVGTLLLGEMTHVQSTAFGFASASAGFHVGNFYQVTVFLLVLVVLVGNLGADVLARLLDPRLSAPGET